MSHKKLCSNINLIIIHTDMKKYILLTSMLLSMLTAISAQDIAQLPTDEASWLCELERKMLGAKHFYCDCKEESVEFSYPMNIEITDTMWFDASISDLRKGLTAFIYSDCSMQIDVFAFCSSKEPSISMTVGKNQMREMDVATINKKIEEMGSVGELADVLTAHMRIYPIGGGTGSMVAYPYEEGPHSTCENTLSVYRSMTMVSSNSNDVYMLPVSEIPSSGTLFVQWKEKKNNPCQMRITRGSCDGETIVETSLNDSTKLYYFDPEVLKTVRAANDDLYLHFSHDASVVGRVRVRVPKFKPIVTDTTICQGMGLQLVDTLLTESTVYIGDTAWITGDTVGVYSYNLVITEPEIQYDTISVKQKDLPLLYRDQGYVDTFGDHDLMLDNYGEKCDERVQLHVLHDVTYTTSTLDTTLCQGRIFEYSGVSYTTDTAFVDSLWLDADTHLTQYVSVHFSAPEAVNDTISLKQTDLPYLYRGVSTVDSFGDHDLLLTSYNTCDEHVLLHVLHDIAYTTSTLDTTLCQGRIFEYSGVSYTTDTAFVDSLWLDADTHLTQYVNLGFTSPELEYDTIVLSSAQLFEGYYYAPADTIISQTGTYNFEVTAYDECTRLIELYVHLDNTTTDLDGIINNESKSRLIMKQGRVYLQIGNKLYTVLGEEILN